MKLWKKIRVKIYPSRILCHIHKSFNKAINYLKHNIFTLVFSFLKLRNFYNIIDYCFCVIIIFGIDMILINFNVYNIADECNFNFKLKGTILSEKFYKTQIGKETFTAEVGLGNINIKDSMLFPCEFILIYNEKYNDDHGTYPMFSDFNDFVYDINTVKPTIFQVVREDIVITPSEICTGTFKKNNKIYNFYLIIRYTDDVVLDLKKNQVYPVISNVMNESKNIKLELRNKIITIYNCEFSEVLQGRDVINNIKKIHKVRGSLPNFGVFILTVESGKCGHIWTLVPKNQAWLQDKDHKAAVLNQENALKIKEADKKMKEDLKQQQVDENITLKPKSADETVAEPNNTRPRTKIYLAPPDDPNLTPIYRSKKD